MDVVVSWRLIKVLALSVRSSNTSLGMYRFSVDAGSIYIFFNWYISFMMIDSYKCQYLAQYFKSKVRWDMRYLEMEDWAITETDERNLLF